MKTTLKRSDGFIHVLPENEFERDWLAKYVKQLQERNRLLEPHLTRNGGIKFQPRNVDKLIADTLSLYSRSCETCNSIENCDSYNRGVRKYNCEFYSKEI